MIIDQLPLLGGDVESNDEIPIERGTTSYKTTQAALVKSAADAAAAAQTSADNAQTSADNVATSLATYVRPNLLDNWYFVGGGSQKGYGTFPINQRGQTVYQTAGAGAIDRWNLNGAGTPSATLNSGGLTLATGIAQGDWCLIQELNVSPLLGKTVTASIKVESVSGRGYIHLYVNPTAPLGAVDISSAGVYSVTFTVPTATTRIRFIIGAPTSMVVSACKVEIGSTQTLAHQENGAWVLNEMPDYAEQLAKCQAYLRKIVAWRDMFIARNDNDGVRIYLPFSMKKTPSSQSLVLKLYITSGAVFKTIDFDFMATPNGICGIPNPNTPADWPAFGVAAVMLQQDVFLSAE